MNAKYVVGILIILGLLVFAGVNFQKSLTPYVSVEVARQKGTLVQIKGEPIAQSEKYDIEQKTFNFEMTDGAGNVFPVVYYGVKPSNFEQAREIVARGHFQEGVFVAEELLVKCPSKYESDGTAMRGD